MESDSSIARGAALLMEEGIERKMSGIENIIHDKAVEEIRQGLNMIAVPLLILSGAAIVYTLVWAEEILVPFVIAIFFTYLLRPLVNCLSRPLGRCLTGRYGTKHRQSTVSRSDDSDLETAELIGKDTRGRPWRGPTAPVMSGAGRCERFMAVKCPRWLAVLLSIIVVVACIGGLVLLIVDAIQTFEEGNLERYENRTIELANAILKWLKDKFDIDGSYVVKALQDQFEIVKLGKTLLLTALNAVAYVFIVFLFLLYMLFEKPHHYSRSAGGRNSRAAALRRQIDAQIQRYLVIKTTISAGIGFITYLVLGPCLGVNMAHLFGVITFLGNYIPNVGAVVATVVPLPVVVLDPELSGLAMFLAFAIPVGIHTIVGNFVEPMIFGTEMEMHPVVVMLSLSFWFAVWGIPGAILSVPIMAVLRIIVSHIRHPYASTIMQLLEGKLP